MRKVLTANHPAEAQMVKDLLEAQGIPAEVRGEMLFGARGELPVAEASPTIWVHEEQIEEAQQAITHIFESAESQSGEPWTCPQCQERHEAQFSSCWSCGASRPAA